MLLCILVKFLPKTRCFLIQFVTVLLLWTGSSKRIVSHESEKMQKNVKIFAERVKIDCKQAWMEKSILKFVKRAVNDLTHKSECTFLSWTLFFTPLSSATNISHLPSGENYFELESFLIRLRFNRKNNHRNSMKLLSKYR